LARRSRLRPSPRSTPRSYSRARRQAAPQVIHVALPCEVTSHSAFALWRGPLPTDRQRHQWNFSLDPKTSGRNRTGGHAIVAPRIAGGMTASLPTYRRIRKRRARPLKAAAKTASCRNERSLCVKGRMMLLVVSILAYQFSPPLLTPSAANQTGVASVYSHESGSGTASGQKLDREAFTAAHRTLPFGTKVKVTNKSNGRSVVVTIND